MHNPPPVTQALPESMTLYPYLAAASLVCLTVAGPTVAQQLDRAEIQRLMEQAGQLQQNIPMPDLRNIQHLQQRAVEMQDCLAKVDHSGMERLRVEGEAVGAEIRTLCNAGQRETAQSRALAYSKRIATSPEVAELSHCGAMLTAILPAATAAASDGAAPTAPGHVCDIDMEP
jgi:hypothetical protein